MAAFRSLASLADTTQDELLPGIIDSLLKNDEFTAAMVANAAVTDRPTVKGNRLTSTGTAAYVGADDAITPEAIETSPFSYDLLTLNRSFSVAVTGQNVYSSFTDVTAAEVEGAIKGIGEKIANDAMVGTTIGGTLSGLEEQCTNTFAISGAGFDLVDTDRLYDEVLSRGSRMAYVGKPGVIRTVLKKLRSAGGITYDVLAGTQLRVPNYLGIPLLRNQWAPDETLFLVNLEEFKLWVGESEDMNVGGVFSLLPVGAMEARLRKLWHMYVNVAAVLHNTQGAAALIGVVEDGYGL